MDNRIVEAIINSRKAVRKKFLELQDNIVHHENYMEKKFKPIADPIKELIKNIKHDNMEVKSEVTDVKNDEKFASSTPKQTSTSKKEVSTPKKQMSTVKSPYNTSIANVSNTGRYTPKTTSQTSMISSIKPRKLSLMESYGRHPVEDDDNDVDIDAIPADQVMQEYRASESFEELLAPFGGRAKTYMSGLFTDSESEYDTTYGPRVDIRKNDEGERYSTGKYLLGSSEINFSDNGEIINIITDEGFKYPYKGSVALYELIFKNHPTEATVRSNPQAIRDYKNILEKTNVHRTKFNPANKLRSNSGYKYKKVIKPILEGNFKSTAFRQSPGGRSRSNTLPSTSQIGKGILKLNNKKVQYVPYKTPNSLVNRLRLLIGAQQAGNNSHDNEITYIIDELKNIKVIK